MEQRRSKPETAIFIAHEDFTKRDIAEPEKNLMRAILRSAMEDIRKRGELYRDARRFFMSNDEFYVYSFLCICQHLELCPRTIRTIMGLTEESSRQDLPEPFPSVAAEESTVAAAQTVAAA